MTDLNTTIKADLTYLKTHLTLLVAVVVLAGGVVYGSESLIASHDSQREAKDSKVLALVMAQTADLKTRMVQDEQAATVRDAQYAAIIAQLSGTIAKQTAQLQKQKQVNATLTAVQTAEAISQKTQAQPGEVQAQADSVVLSLPVARTINSNLDELVTIKTQLNETENQFALQKKLTDDAMLDAENAKNVIVSQADQMVQAEKVCKDQIAVVKAQARKSKLKWFGVGYVLGLVTARFIGI